jgi:predicted HicB family RNase H-like nuclease|tara:strand:+ start:2607 stop:2780 length:174 start_codon:yes stop_codon:yes gene_type:complete
MDYKLIHVKLEPKLHRILRLECADKELSIQEYVSNLLEKNLHKSAFAEKSKKKRDKG